jgi:hypothetical protein
MAKFRLTPKRGTRVLPELELKQFLEWLPICKLPDKAKHILLLTLYTGCRTGEWCNAKVSRNLADSIHNQLSIFMFFSTSPHDFLIAHINNYTKVMPLLFYSHIS